jgi:hypothetical protein
VKQPPLLLRGGLSGRIYVVTRYKVLDAEKGRIEAITKHDVTDQYEALLRERYGRRDEDVLLTSQVPLSEQGQEP